MSRRLTEPQAELYRDGSPTTAASNRSSPRWSTPQQRQRNCSYIRPPRSPAERAQAPTPEVGGVPESERQSALSLDGPYGVRKCGARRDRSGGYAFRVRESPEGQGTPPEASCGPRPPGVSRLAGEAVGVTLVADVGVGRRPRPGFGAGRGLRGCGGGVMGVVSPGLAGLLGGDFGDGGASCGLVDDRLVRSEGRDEGLQGPSAPHTQSPDTPAAQRPSRTRRPRRPALPSSQVHSNAPSRPSRVAKTSREGRRHHHVMLTMTSHTKKSKPPTPQAPPNPAGSAHHDVTLLTHDGGQHQESFTPVRVHPMTQ